MKFFVARSKEVPVREQIVTQVTLGIVSGELGVGVRLPSTREMARRFGVHANTVSAAYRLLERQGRVESRRGSGVYVRLTEIDDGPAVADRLIAGLFAEARRLGVTTERIRLGLENWLKVEAPTHFVVVEPDVELREIIVAEMRDAVSLPLRGVGVDQFGGGRGGFPVVLPSKEHIVRRMLVPGEEMMVVQVNAVVAELAPWLPAPVEALVGLCSRWPEFVRMGRAVLIGAGIEASALVVRDAREIDWQRGLEETVAIVCDVVVAAQVRSSAKVIPFRILADRSVAELRRVEALMVKRT